MIVVTLGAGGYFGYQHEHRGKTYQKAKATTTNTTQNVPNPVSLKAYTNNEYGFSFKYPADWTLAINMGEGDSGHLVGSISVKALSGLTIFFNPSQGGKGGSCVADANDTPFNTANCSTTQILSAQQIDTSSINGKPLYFYEAKFSSGGAEAKIRYIAFIDNAADPNTDLQPFMGANLGLGIVYTNQPDRNGQVVVFTKADADISADFLQSPDMQAAEDILRSFKIMASE